MSEQEEKIAAPGNPGALMSWARAVGFFRGFLVVSLIPVSTGAVIAWRSGAFTLHTLGPRFPVRHV
jgi:hypothetical protein